PAGAGPGGGGPPRASNAPHGPTASSTWGDLRRSKSGAALRCFARTSSRRWRISSRAPDAPLPRRISAARCRKDEVRRRRVSMREQPASMQHRLFYLGRPPPPNPARRSAASREPPRGGGEPRAALQTLRYRAGFRRLGAARTRSGGEGFLREQFGSHRQPSSYTHPREGREVFSCPAPDAEVPAAELGAQASVCSAGRTPA